jgi:hypothetical protein
MTTLATDIDSRRPARDPVQRKLRAAWWRQQLRAHLLGLGRVAIGLLVLVLAACMLDWLFVLPPVGRMALLAISAAVLIGLAYACWWRSLERFDPFRMALRVERSFPRLSNLLVTYVQTPGDSQSLGGTSESMWAAARQQAVVATQPIDFASIVRFDKLQRPLVILLALWLAFAALVFTNSRHFGVMAKRLLNPFSDLAYPTRTQIERVTGDVTVPPGASVKLAAYVQGAVPQTGELQVRDDAGHWQPLVVGRGEDDWFVRELTGVRAGFVYRWVIGDDQSDAYRVHVVRPPQIVDAQVELVWPKSMKQDAVKTSKLNLQVPPGTQVIWRITLDRAVRSAIMWRLNDEDPLGRTPLAPMTIVGGRELQAAWTADRPVQYGFTLKGDRHGFEFDDPLTYAIELVEDVPPQVELLDADTLEDIATVNKQVQLRYRATDDRGVLAANVVFRVNDGPEQRYELARYEGKRFVEDQRSWRIRDSLPEVRPGDSIQFAVEVIDQAGPREGQVAARSQAQQMRIVTLAQYQRAVMEKLQQVRRELESARQAEAQAIESLDQLKQEQTP